MFVFVLLYPIIVSSIGFEVQFSTSLQYKAIIGISTAVGGFRWGSPKQRWYVVGLVYWIHHPVGQIVLW